MAWGKIIGTTLGAFLGGPIGAGLGIAAGEFVDKFIEEENKSVAVQKDNKIQIKFNEEINKNISHFVIYFSTSENHDHENIKSTAAVFSDNEGYAMFIKRVTNDKFTIVIPIAALDINQKKRHHQLFIKLLGMNGDEMVTGILMPVSIQLIENGYNNFDWTEPFFKLLNFYALLNSSWNTDKVKLIKGIAESVCSKEFANSVLFRDFLKSKQDEGLLEICMDYADEYYNMDERLILDLLEGVINTLRLDKKPNAYIETELKGLHKWIVFDEEILNREISDLYGNGSNHESNSNQDRNNYSNDRSNNKYESEHQSHSPKWAREILEVTASATPAEVNKAFRKKMSDLHPDKYADKPKIIQDFVNEQAKNLNKARDILLAKEENCYASK